jgi:hypothetical protein
MRALSGGAQGADFGRHLVGRADDGRARFGAQALQKGLLHPRLHQQPRPRHAALPAGREYARDLRIRRTVQIGILKHDEGRLSPQFQTGGRQIFGTGPHDMARGLRPAGKRDMRNQRVLRQSLPCIRPARQDIKHSGGKARIMDQAGEFQQGGRAIFAGFDNNRAARRQSRANLDRRQEQLRIPRHNRGHDAHGFAAQPHLHIRFVDGQVRPFDLVRQSGVIAVILGHIGDLRAGFANDLARIAGFQRGQSRGCSRNQISQPEQQLAARGGGHLWPVPRRECPVRRTYSAVHVCRARLRHSRPGLSRRGVKAVELRSTPVKRAVNIVLKLFHPAPFQAKAGITSCTSRSSEAFLRSKLIPESIQKLNSS